MNKKDTIKPIHLTETEINILWKKACESVKKNPDKYTDTSMVRLINEKLKKDKKLKKENRLLYKKINENIK